MCEEKWKVNFDSLWNSAKVEISKSSFHIKRIFNIDKGELSKLFNLTNGEKLFYGRLKTMARFLDFWPIKNFAPKRPVFKPNPKLFSDVGLSNLWWLPFPGWRDACKFYFQGKRSDECEKVASLIIENQTLRQRVDTSDGDRQQVEEELKSVKQQLEQAEETSKNYYTLFDGETIKLLTSNRSLIQLIMGKISWPPVQRVSRKLFTFRNIRKRQIESATLNLLGKLSLSSNKVQWPILGIKPLRS